MTKNDDVIKTLRPVIQVLLDGQKGLAAVGSEVKDETAKHCLMEETQVRALYAAELENELHRLGVPDVSETGTPAGTAHRVWGDLKSLLGGGDRTLLATAEQGEDEAKAAYAEALKEKLPADIAGILRRQQSHILASHDTIRGLRDSAAK